MKCPHCGLGINFEEQDEYNATYQYNESEKSGLGYELIHGHCPACERLIVILNEGKFKRGQHGAELTEITKEEVLYPKIIMPKILEPEIPEKYRNDYLEAYSVLHISPKASAAISRRLLQHLLSWTLSIFDL